MCMFMCVLFVNLKCTTRQGRQSSSGSLSFARRPASSAPCPWSEVRARSDAQQFVCVHRRRRRRLCIMTERSAGLQRHRWPNDDDHQRANAGHLLGASPLHAVLPQYESRKLEFRTMVFLSEQLQLATYGARDRTGRPVAVCEQRPATANSSNNDNNKK